MFIKKVSFSLIVGFSVCNAFAFENEIPPHEQTQKQTPVSKELDEARLELEAKQKIKEFANTLQSTLKSAISEGGLQSGVTVCKDKAPEIGNELSVNGWEVARTSLKTRNQNNTPDSWETKNLIAFEEAFNSGQQISSLAASSLDETSYRYMKAIPTKQICLSCHGQNINADLVKTIDKFYLNDMARGYSLDDIRGAFTVKKKLEK